MSLNNGHLMDISDILRTFNGHLENLIIEVEILNTEAKELEAQILENVPKILDVEF